MAEGGNREGREEGPKILCWNVAGLYSKRENDNFWEYIKKFDIIILIETWLEEEEWNIIQGERLSKEYQWEREPAVKDFPGGFGRASGGIIVGIKNGLKKHPKNSVSKDILESEVKIGSEYWRIIAVYWRGGEQEVLTKLNERLKVITESNRRFVEIREINRRLEEITESNSRLEEITELNRRLEEITKLNKGLEETTKVMVLGDFNARTRRDGSITWPGAPPMRTSKDGEKEAQGGKLIEIINRHKLGILNGNKEGDLEGEWTSVGFRSVRDYGICNKKTWEVIKEFKVVDRTESDHLPLEVVLEGETEENRKRKEFKIIFWNVTSINERAEKFQNYIQDFDIIILIRKEVEGQGWTAMVENMPNHVWGTQSLNPHIKKGTEGILVGVKKSREINVSSEQPQNTEEDPKEILEIEVKIGSENWKILAIYNQNKNKGVLTALARRLEGTDGRKMIVLGDFKARTGNERSLTWEGAPPGRTSKDEISDEEGEDLLKIIIDGCNLGILNGNKNGDEEGKLTFVPRGKSVIDYAICNKQAWKEITEFRVVDRKFSDHLPLEIVLKDRETESREE